MQERSGTLKEFAVVAVAFAVAAAVFTLPLALRATRALPSDLTDTLLNTWIIGWDADRLRHGLAGVWNAPIYFPYHDTLAFSENLLGVAVLVAPVYWLSGNAVLTYNTAFLLSFVIAGVGMYWLVRTLTGSRTAAAVAGAYYAFCPFRMAQIAHIQMVATGWLPVMLLALHQFFATRARRWLALFATAAVLQAVSNSYVAYYMLVPAVIVAADGLVRTGGARVRMAAECAVAGAVIAVTLLPVAAAYRRARTDYQQVRSFPEIVDGGADLRAYIVGQNHVGIWRWLPTAVVSDPEKELFPGIFAVALALVAFRTSPASRRSVGLYAAIALAGLLCSLGPHVRVWGERITTHGPYEWLLWLIPGMNGMRVPARFAIVFVVGLSVLIGYGASVLLASLPPRAAAAAAAAVIAVLVAEGWSAPLNLQEYSGRGRPEDRAAAAWIAPRPPGAVLHWPIKQANFAEVNYQFATLLHGHPLVNGFSGYNTPVQTYLREPRSLLYDYDRFPAVVRALRAMGVRYVVVHPGDARFVPADPGEVALLEDRLRQSGQVVESATLYQASAYELAPWVEPPRDQATAIDPATLIVSVSESADRVRNLTDGDADTRWFGAADGFSWISVRLPEASDVARVELLLSERSRFDYPRALAISTDDPAHSAPLYEGTPYAEFLQAYVRDSRYPLMVLTLPHNRTRTLRIEAPTGARQWWSVHELRIWRR